MKNRIMCTTLAMAALALVGTAIPQAAQAGSHFKTRTYTRTIETPILMQKAIEQPVLMDTCVSAPVLTDSCATAPVLMEKCVQTPVLIEKTLSAPVIIEEKSHLFDFSIKRLLHVGLF